jgi:hypothetical protein
MQKQIYREVTQRFYTQYGDMDDVNQYFDNYFDGRKIYYYYKIIPTKIEFPYIDNGDMVTHTVSTYPNTSELDITKYNEELAYALYIILHTVGITHEQMMEKWGFKFRVPETDSEEDEEG